MLQKSRSTSNVILVGLADHLVGELERVLSEERYAVYSYPFFPARRCLNLIEQVNAEVVFCAAEPDRCRPLLEAIKEKETEPPGCRG